MVKTEVEENVSGLDLKLVLRTHKRKWIIREMDKIPQ
jgi:hypothetical protein